MHQLLEICPCRIDLPPGFDGFFEQTGHRRAEFSDRRQFRRVLLREQALLQIQKQLSVIYTSDLSRGGICFLHSEQLFPGDRIRIWRSSGADLHLVVARCLRHGPRCYECGAEAACENSRATCAQLVRELITEKAAT